MVQLVPCSADPSPAPAEHERWLAAKLRRAAPAAAPPSVSYSIFMKIRIDYICIVYESSVIFSKNVSVTVLIF